jgi:FKBP-type peptidyl-prolyl cis-trans isomerase 2
LESEKIKKGDFVELEYTGKLKDGNAVFDTTDKEVAEKAGLSKKAEYKPIIICVGEGYILPAIEEHLVGKEIGRLKVELDAEQGFGKKSAQLLKLIPMKVFVQQEIMPYPGLEVNIDNSFGIIRNVSGGRVIVDFNHPLSGRELVYDIEVKRFVTDEKEQLESFLKVTGLHYNSASVKEKKAMVVLEHEMPEQLLKAVGDKVKKTMGLEKIDFIAKKQEKKPAESKKHEHKHEHNQ